MQFTKLHNALKYAIHWITQCTSHERFIEDGIRTYQLLAFSSSFAIVSRSWNGQRGKFVLQSASKDEVSEDIVLKSGSQNSVPEEIVFPSKSRNGYSENCVLWIEIEGQDFKKIVPSRYLQSSYNPPTPPTSCLTSLSSKTTKRAMELELYKQDQKSIERSDLVYISHMVILSQSTNT